VRRTAFILALAAAVAPWHTTDVASVQAILDYLNTPTS
jgi:hypothetical protein